MGILFVIFVFIVLLHHNVRVLLCIYICTHTRMHIKRQLNESEEVEERERESKNILPFFSVCVSPIKYQVNIRLAWRQQRTNTPLSMMITMMWKIYMQKHRKSVTESQKIYHCLLLRDRERLSKAKAARSQRAPYIAFDFNNLEQFTVYKDFRYTRLISMPAYAFLRRKMVRFSLVNRSIIIIYLLNASCNRCSECAQLRIVSAVPPLLFDTQKVHVRSVLCLTTQHKQISETKSLRHNQKKHHKIDKRHSWLLGNGKSSDC